MKALVPGWTTPRRDESKVDLRSWVSILAAVGAALPAVEQHPELVFHHDATIVHDTSPHAIAHAITVLAPKNCKVKAVQSSRAACGLDIELFAPVDAGGCAVPPFAVLQDPKLSQLYTIARG